MKPQLSQINLASARLLTSYDYLIQRKSDGQHTIATLPQFPGFQFNGERMRDDSIRVNDVMLYELCTRERMAELRHMSRHFPHGFELEQADVDIDAEIAAGGEGVVLKPWDSPFGVGWLKAKRSENFLVRVIAFNGAAQSVTIADVTTGEPRGKVALLGGKCDCIRAQADGGIGSILKVTGFGLTGRGCIREPRPDRDTPESWLVQY